MDRAELSLGNQKIELPIVVGSEGEKAVDISKLRSQTGFITLDPGYVNTGSCESKITFIDGEKGILRYRGISIEDVCGNLDFPETAYIIIYGDLPTQEQYNEFLGKIHRHMSLEPGIVGLLRTFPENAHPMCKLMAAVSSLSAYYPYDVHSESDTDEAVIQFFGMMPGLCAAVYRTSRGLDIV
ncbi:MAG: citrate/2-methylcitrate synthase, partial [Acidobacteriota bacterium]|nr:citrate/2-methylcitrate synthase [Acidobacteriota bacterium]